jgi:NAD(P)-dependent dehydrogenase (short-subunit alcohol dehydrogenase family)
MEKRVALVTGGAQGIGRAISEAFLRSGMRVAIVDCDGPALDQARQRCTQWGEVLALQLDVGEADAARQAVKRTVSAWGALDVLVNNAGIMIRKPPEELSLAEWQRVLAINLTAPFVASREAAPYLRDRRGCIINIASTRALMSEPHTEAYSASKGGIAALTHAMAMSFGPEIRVNAISPGWIDVSAWGTQGESAREALTAEDHAQHPAGRVGTPEDIARAAFFLADPANDFITGENLVIDGGMTRKMIYL